jgi:uncharacterized repeat protein (TIGR01451 family)
MKTKQLLTVLGCIAATPLASSFTAATAGEIGKAEKDYGNLPLHFEENVGQFESDRQFVARNSGYTVSISSSGATVQLRKGSAADGAPATVQMQLLGANKLAKPTAMEKLPGAVNYLVGNDPSAWRTKVPMFGRVKYQEVYRGVDLLYYGNQRQLEYDFVVAPGTDPRAIRMRLAGARKLSVNDTGDLVIELPNGDVLQRAPQFYQVIHNQRRPVSGRYILSGDSIVGFQIDSYDQSKPLIIDPILVYSTYLGGTGGDRANSVAIDSAGNAYITGSTASTDLATTTGSLQRASTLADVFKSTNAAAGWKAAGAGLPNTIISTIAVDPTVPSTLYAGTTQSNDFESFGIFKSTNGGATWQAANEGLTSTEIIKIVIDPKTPATVYALTDGLLFKSTNHGDNWTIRSDGLPSSGPLSDLVVDPKTPTTLYISSGPKIFKTTNGGTSWTQISQLENGVRVLAINPVTPSILYAGLSFGFFSETPGGVFKSTDSGVTWKPTGLSRDTDFSPGALAIDPTNPSVVYVGETSIPTQFSGQVHELVRTTDGGAHWTVILTGDGNSDQLAINDITIAPTSPSTLYIATGDRGVIKSTNQGQTFAPSTLSVGYTAAVALDPANSNTVYAGTRGLLGSSSSQNNAFVAKLNPSGTALIYLTYLAGVGNAEAKGIAVDGAGSAYVTGFTSTGSFPTTAGAFQAAPADGPGKPAGFVAKLKPDGSGLVYSTYLSGTGVDGNLPDEGHAIAVDSAGRAVVVGQASSGDFPTTAGAFDPSGPGVFVTKFDAQGAKLLYSTMLGQRDHIGDGVALDSTGKIYVTGSAFFGFPTTASAYQGSVTGEGQGAFFAKLDPTASGAASLVYSTYLNGSKKTLGHAIAVDSAGKVYLTGSTTSQDFPTRKGFQTVFGGFNQNTQSPTGDAFVVKMDPALSGDASLVYSSFLGGTGDEIGYGIAVDSAGKAVVTGSTFSTDFPSKAAFQPFLGNESAFVTRVDTAGTGANSLLYSTLLGGTNASTQGHGIAADSSGNAYVAGFTSGQDFPTKSAPQPTNRGGTDAFVMKISGAGGSANLSVTNNSSPDPVKQGANVTYTIVVSNTGPNAATGVVLADTLDPAVTFVSATVAPATNAGGTLTFKLGTLQSGAHTQVQIVAQVGTPAPSQNPSIANTALVHSDLSDPVLTNNRAVEVTAVKPSFVNLKIEGTTVPNPAVTAKDFTYKLTVTNAGPDPASSVVVAITLPSEVNFISAAPAPTTRVGQALTFTLPGTLAKNAKAVISIVVHPNIPTGFIGTQVTVESKEADTNKDDNKTFVDTAIVAPDTADVQATLIGPESPAPVGNLTYKLVVRNNGPHGATGVVVTDAFTAGTNIVSVTAPSGVTTSKANGTVTCNVGNLLVGQTVTITIVINVPTDARITSDANVTANEKDGVTSNNEPGTVRITIRNGSVVFKVLNTNDKGPGSLRQAMLDSEGTPSSIAVPNKIVFNIPGSDPGRDPGTGVFTISPLSRLPGIFEPVIIDGYTQPGAKPNTNGIGSPINAKILIEIEGSQAGRPTSGFVTYARNCTFRGLAINRFVTKLQRGVKSFFFDGDAIEFNFIEGRVEGCFIGTDATGTIARGNEVLGIASFDSNNHIGGTQPAQRNLISGNGGAGIGTASSTSGVTVEGNFIGTDISGAKGLPTNILTVEGFSLFSGGVDIGANQNVVGGTTAASRNIISGNAGHGVEILRVSDAGSGASGQNNLIEGNYIGTDLTGKKAVPNGGDGVYILGNNNTIGGTTPAARNIISGNIDAGVHFDEVLNVVQGNFIGTDVTGLQPLGNTNGIYASSFLNTVGGTTANSGNLISGNVQSGILLDHDETTVAGNSIGLDLNDAPLGNGGDGVTIRGLPNSGQGAPLGNGNVINGGNMIAFNGASGVSISSFATGAGAGNTISGNSIFSNRLLGIDLVGGSESANGVTANHAGGPIANTPNRLQNYPVLTSAVSSGGSTVIKGTLNSAASTGYTIDFYSNEGGDPSGFGEGQDFVGSTTTTTDANGNTSFTLSVPKSLGGLFISATATTPSPGFGNDTSEFSKFILCTGAAPNPPPAISADLGITGSASPIQAKTNNPLTYTFVVTNHGPNTAPTVVVTDVLPAGIRVESVHTTRGNGSVSGNTASCNLGNMPSNASATITIVVTPLTVATVHNTAIVRSNAKDAVAANNSAKVTTTVTAGTATTDLVVTQTAMPSPVKLGTDLLYIIKVTNKGPLTATNVSLTDTLPPNVTFNVIESSPEWVVNGSKATLSYGALAANDSIKAFITIKPNAAGTITNKVVVSLAQSDATPANNTSSLQTTVLKAPSVTVLTSAPSSSSPGKTTYTATVTSTTTGLPTGTVIFRQGSTVLGTVAVDKNGRATLTITPPAGGTAVTAAYNGDGNLLPSSSDLSAVAVAVPAQLLNISTRMEVLTGNNVLIGGFIVTGSNDKKVMLRAIGPSLPVAGPLADPVLELHGKSGIIATNDSWKIDDKSGQSQQAAINATTIPPKSDLESALIATLPASGSAYTAIVHGKNNGTGVGQVEVYDLGTTANSQLANISTRGFVDTGDNVMIGGFISGNGSGASRIIARGIGPSLGINGALQDPTLELHDKNGTTIASNDNWQDDPNSAKVQAAGVAPKDSRESAIYTVLPPSSYTGIVRGKSSTTGIGLVEVYNLR